MLMSAGPEQDSFKLVLKDELLGTLDVLGPDQPWFECRFRPAEGFEAVRHLFDRELALLEDQPTFDPSAWEAAWNAIWQAGVSLETSRGEQVAGFVVHIYPDGIARLRTP